MTRLLVEAIVSRKPWGTIFVGRIVEARESGSIKVKLLEAVASSMPDVGETWDVEGDFAETAWGPQLTAKAARRLVPGGKLIAAFLSRKVPGIGEERASRLWDAFGTQLGTILEDDRNIPAVAAAMAPDRPALGPSLAAAVVRTWREAVEETRLLEWLSRHGVTDTAVARTAAVVLGGKAVERLERNPYILVPFLPWPKVDELGLRLLGARGVPEARDDPRRLVGAVDAAVKAVLADGDTAVTADGLVSRLRRLLGVSATSPRLVAALTAGQRNGAVIAGPAGWRAPGFATMEIAVVRRLRAMLAPDHPDPVALPDEARLREAVAAMTDSRRPLHREQLDATARILSSSFSCLQGGGGVGKTYLTRVICDVWEAHGGSVLPCALAGKAALRLSQSTGRLARTLARTLAELEEREAIAERLAGGGLEERERRALVDRAARLAELKATTLVIVDEASMVDIATIHRILRRTPLGARLLLVGDEAQLPPIGPGLVYHRLAADPAVTVRLSVVHRQAAETGIPAIADLVRRRVVPDLPDYAGPGAGVSVLRAREHDVSDAVARVAADLGGHGGGLLVVCAMNGGVAGVRALNERFHRAHVEGSELGEIKGFLGNWFSPGDPVIFTRNDYRRGLFNGLLGRVKRIDHDRATCHVRFDGANEDVELERPDLVDLSLAYAITCHKAQGSQAAQIVIPLVGSRLLNPSWLYTAVTRAERQVVLVGDPDVLAEALSRAPEADTRLVGFDWAADGTDLQPPGDTRLGE